MRTRRAGQHREVSIENARIGGTHSLQVARPYDGWNGVVNYCLD
ncbi:hypothetical protein QMK38_15695 [Lysinibacillus fusiformis]|nr:hypothetical protein [Lysinibacillus fusiformis]